MSFLRVYKCQEAYYGSKNTVEITKVIESTRIFIISPSKFNHFYNFHFMKISGTVQIRHKKN